MLFTQRVPPRSFAASSSDATPTLDCGTIALSTNEQVTFDDALGRLGHTDVTRKEWGYYLTRSCNDYQGRNGWRTAIVRNLEGRTYVVLVDLEESECFRGFLMDSNHTVILWVDELP